MTDELSGDLEEPALSSARGRPSKIDLYVPFTYNGVHKTLVVFEQTEIEQCLQYVDNIRILYSILNIAHARQDLPILYCNRLTN